MRRSGSESKSYQPIPEFTHAPDYSPVERYTSNPRPFVALTTEQIVQMLRLLLESSDTWKPSPVLNCEQFWALPEMVAPLLKVLVPSKPHRQGDSKTTRA